MDNVTGQRIVDLPLKTIHDLKVDLSTEEAAIYRKIELASRQKFKLMMAQGQVMKDFSHVLEMLLRLRQCCTHLALLPPEYLQDDVSFSERQLSTAQTVLTRVQTEEGGDECMYVCVCAPV